MSERMSVADTFPETLTIEPFRNPVTGVVRVPGSKSITNRALILAALSDPSACCILRGALRSEDTEVMIQALRALGFQVDSDWSQNSIQVQRNARANVIPAERADIFVGNSGTSMRFLTALVSLGHGRYRLDGISRMRERPIEDLLGALRQLGVKVSSEDRPGFPPIVVEADGLAGGQVRMRGDVSSQFLSALLMAAPMARAEITIHLDGGLVSRPYVEMTRRMMSRAGVNVETDLCRFRVPNVPHYRARQIDIEPDASAASYFLAAAAITGGTIRIPGLGDQSLQGDVRFAHLLTEMGCRVHVGQDCIELEGGSLHGIEADMVDVSDCVMTLAVVALFAEGPTTIRNVSHIRHKETDRLVALANELRRVGAGVKELADGLEILPQTPHGAVVETYNDHRMAMSFSLIGLRVPGVVVRNPGCVAKTYPRFFDDLEKLRQPRGAEIRTC
jgi:3-phosphoshikimate 1-carboxyvinyltransferase